ncbi:hypothetical protein GQ43DRAFT_430479 [Delitschia confertaspora ATCC 74209]|uniref:Uncharacterized protein n=1 Tax=Delitschia confertaspora ATCC 74209 TaxID=1513339 RepID=A0A9P4JNH3_9PLEO|nr:hypothetical protein GQ43DRAFT_430479 [Delitschia confertaspora ATCC 74209]
MSASDEEYDPADLVLLPPDTPYVSLTANENLYEAPSGDVSATPQLDGNASVFDPKQVMVDEQSSTVVHHDAKPLLLGKDVVCEELSDEVGDIFEPNENLSILGIEQTTAAGKSSPVIYNNTGLDDGKHILGNNVGEGSAYEIRNISASDENFSTFVPEETTTIEQLSDEIHDNTEHHEETGILVSEKESAVDELRTPHSRSKDSNHSFVESRSNGNMPVTQTQAELYGVANSNKNIGISLPEQITTTEQAVDEGHDPRHGKTVLIPENEVTVEEWGALQHRSENSCSSVVNLDTKGYTLAFQDQATDATGINKQRGESCDGKAEDNKVHNKAAMKAGFADAFSSSLSGAEVSPGDAEYAEKYSKMLKSLDGTTAGVVRPGKQDSASRNFALSKSFHPTTYQQLSMDDFQAKVGEAQKGLQQQPSSGVPEQVEVSPTDSKRHDELKGSDDSTVEFSSGLVAHLIPLSQNLNDRHGIDSLLAVMAKRPQKSQTSQEEEAKANEVSKRIEKTKISTTLPMSKNERRAALKRSKVKNTHSVLDTSPEMSGFNSVLTEQIQNYKDRKDLKALYQRGWSRRPESIKGMMDAHVPRSEIIDEHGAEGKQAVSDYFGDPRPDELAKFYCEQLTTTWILPKARFIWNFVMNLIQYELSLLGAGSTDGDRAYIMQSTFNRVIEAHRKMVNDNSRSIKEEKVQEKRKWKKELVDRGLLREKEEKPQIWTEYLHECLLLGDNKFQA